jgi:hypothetical protein
MALVLGKHAAFLLQTSDGQYFLLRNAYTYVHNVWLKYRAFNIKVGGIQSNPCALKGKLHVVFVCVCLCVIMLFVWPHGNTW